MSQFDPSQVNSYDPDTYDGRCGKCYGLGAWLTPQGIIAECPKLQLGHDDHPQPGEAAQMILRAGRQMQYRKVIANDLAFRVARHLAVHGTTAEPVTRQELIGQHFEYARSQVLRELHKVIESLRSEWLLPVGSRKHAPNGYWICVEERDFREWVERYNAAPLRQLTTSHRLAKAHWPHFAEQLELDFWNNVEPVEVSSVPKPSTG